MAYCRKPIKQVVQHFEPAPAPEVREHSLLCLRAEKWLTQINCSVVIRDPFRSSTAEQPDAIGWRDGVSILIECKSSRADFLADRNKSFRKDPTKGMGDWRFYMCPKGMITVADLPPGWGLLYVTPKSVLKVHGFPPNTRWSDSPFIGNKSEENTMLTSTLRRLSLRGHLPDIYKGIPNRCPDCRLIY